MGPEYVGLIGFVVLLLLMVLGVPVAFSMVFVAVPGLWYLVGFQAASEIVVNTSFRFATTWDFTAVPLFLVMGYFAANSGLVTKAFESARVWVSKLPGGLGMATTVAGGMLGACMGSGVSATAAMSRIAVPEMLRHKYDKSLAAGIVAATAPIAVLIPPSLTMVIYATYTGTSLARLMLGGYLPGVLTVLMYCIWIGVLVALNPKLAPRVSGEIITWRQRISALKDVWGIIVLIAVLLVGVYSGFFTATEAAALGGFAAFILTFITRTFTWSAMRRSLIETVEITALTFLIMAASALFTSFITVSGLPMALSALVVDANLSPFLFVVVVVILNMFLGCFMPGISILLVTLPVLLPVFIDLKVDLIWFGIVFIKTVEIGGLTPPFGLAIFVVKGVMGDEISTGAIFRGSGRFIVTEILITAILMAWPQITLWLPNTMRGG
jgi:C4-dicarboxylate transporter DctM subunit